MGGKPTKGTSADKRLSANKTGSASAGAKMQPTAMPKMPKVPKIGSVGKSGKMGKRGY